MSPGSVLVIDDDEWVGRLLAVALREAGYEVFHSASAVAGYEQAVEKQPDCIICDVDLPDVDGFWVARKIRMSADRVSVTPFLFLSGLDDRDTRLQGFHVGADVYMTKPFRIDEVVAQVGALVQMAKRLRQHRRTFLSVPPMEAAMTGDLAQMSVATVLTLLDMERRSGTLEVASKAGQATLTILAGAIGGATLDGKNQEPLELLRTLLAWNEGRFSFHPDSTRSKTAADTSINALLMEAVRLEDEKHAGELPDPSSEQPGSRRRLPRIGRTTGTSELAPALQEVRALATAAPPATTVDAAPEEPRVSRPRELSPPKPLEPLAPRPPEPAAAPPRAVAPKPPAPRLSTSPAAPRAPGAQSKTSVTLPSFPSVSSPSSVVPNVPAVDAPPAPAGAKGTLITPSPAAVERAQLDEVLDELIPISLSTPSTSTPGSASATEPAPSAVPTTAVIESGWSEPPPAPRPGPPPPPKNAAKVPAAPTFTRKPTPAPQPAGSPRTTGIPRPAPTPKPVGAPVATKPPIPAPPRQGSGEK